MSYDQELAFAELQYAEEQAFAAEQAAAYEAYGAALVAEFAAEQERVEIASSVYLPTVEDWEGVADYFDSIVDTANRGSLA